MITTFIRIPAVLAESFTNPLHLGMAALQRLRDAGSTVQGTLWPMPSPTHRVAYWVEYGTGDYVFEVQEDELAEIDKMCAPDLQKQLEEL